MDRRAPYTPHVHEACMLLDELVGAVVEVRIQYQIVGWAKELWMRVGNRKLELAIKLYSHNHVVFADLEKELEIHSYGALVGLVMALEIRNRNASEELAKRPALSIHCMLMVLVKVLEMNSHDV